MRGGEETRGEERRGEENRRYQWREEKCPTSKGGHYCIIMTVVRL